MGWFSEVGSPPTEKLGVASSLQLQPWLQLTAALALFVLAELDNLVNEPVLEGLLRRPVQRTITDHRSEVKCEFIQWYEY